MSAGGPTHSLSTDTGRNLAADRALAALRGLALGDALGMPTQSMAPEEIRRHYGRIAGLRDAVASQPVAPGMPAGSVTDDTEQALLVARILIDGNGSIDPRVLARTLLDWEEDMIARGSLDLLGPSTKAALEKVRTGADPRTTGRTGTTNGAAMRVAPVGIARGLDDLDAFARTVHESCVVTHDTPQGWQSAALVSAAVSAGVDGQGTREAIETALAVVGALPARGHRNDGPSVLARTREALRGAPSPGRSDLGEYLRERVGTSVESAESVPAALVVAHAYADDPMSGLCFAAALGGDTDTIGAIAGAILGATLGTRALPDAEVDVVARGLGLEPLSAGLVALRGVRMVESGGGRADGHSARPGVDSTHASLAASPGPDVDLGKGER